MRYIIIILLSMLLFWTVACDNATKNQAGQAEVISKKAENGTNTEPIDPDMLPEFKFDKESHDFGTITEGEKVSYTYSFKNVGKSELVITRARASCGCTVPEYTKEPIAPGEEGEVEITFNSANRKGKQYKKVTLYANTQPNTKELTFTADVQ